MIAKAEAILKRTAAPHPKRGVRGGVKDQPHQDARHEIKMVCGEESFDRILAELRLLSCGVRTLHPERIVQSLYFDTPDGRAVQDNESGASDRQKLRLRWYGKETAGIHGRLEYKIRRNQYGWKEVMEIKEPLDIRGVSKHALLRRLRRFARDRFRERLGGDMEVAQWIRYTRQYFITGDGAVRFTIDRDLRAFDQRSRLTLSDRCPTHLPRILVVECKAPADRYDRLQAAMASMPLVIGRCSKFVLASDEPGGPLLSHAAV